MTPSTPRGSGAGAEDDGPASTRDQHRQRVVEVAAELLERGGREAVTTRAVADAAGLQPPAIYRLFGDKDGLLEAVAEYGFTKFIAAKRIDPDPADPIDDLRAGWDLAVEFGLSNPALYTLMYSEPANTGSAAFQAGLRILRDRVHRLAAAGRLRVDEQRAAEIIHATGRGAVLTRLSFPGADRDPGLLIALREAMVTAVTNERPAVAEAGPAAAARALRATLPEETALSAAERHLLREWLDRLAAGD